MGLQIIIICTTLSSFTFFINENLYRFIIQEDGIVENMTAFAMFTAALLIYRLFKVRRNREWVIYNILLAVGCFFIAGEEISWGQRIFSINRLDEDLKSSG